MTRTVPCQVRSQSVEEDGDAKRHPPPALLTSSVPSADKPERYSLALAGGALLAREATLVSPVYLSTHDWERTRTRLLAENTLQSRLRSSALRLTREVVQRLQTLSDAEIAFLVKATPSETSVLMWVAMCRRYSLVGDFAEQVLREHFLLRAMTLSHEDFNAFVAERSVWHPELTEARESTLKKVRQRVFRAMTEAGLLIGDQIQPVVLSPGVSNLLGTCAPGVLGELRFLPTNEEWA